MPDKSFDVVINASDILREFPNRLRVDLVPSSTLENFAAYLAGDTAAKRASANAGKVFAEVWERICIDPALDVSFVRRAKSSPETPYFDDPVGAIEEFRLRRISRHVKATAKTSVGRTVDSLLDYALGTSRMVIIVGASGTGKTFAA